MENSIIYTEKLSNGKTLIVRYPNASDAESLLNFINELSDERTFITYQGEHETIESESNYLNNNLKKISEKTMIQLLAFIDNKLVGNTQIELGSKTNKHVALFRISVSKDYRGQGIGKILMDEAEKEAIKNLDGIEIITLGVFACNLKAQEMYKKAGYIEEGRLPNGIKLENGYDDHIYMYKVLNK